MKKKNIILIGILLLLVISSVVVILVVNKEKKKEDKNENRDEVVENIEDKEEKKVTIIDLENKDRPYAVMINTHNGAIPQAGLQNAYIVYELMVEGGITRMMALFKGKDVDKIGSVRSARTQYLGYVYENDAIYVHAGGAKDALNRISSEGINDVDVDGPYGVRDTSLNRAWEHTLFTSTDLIKSGMNARGFRTESNVSNLLTYQADSLDLNNYENKSIANNVSINYSYYRTSNYSYNADTKTYLRSFNNTDDVDLVTGKQMEVKNIIVYAVNYSSYCYNNYCAYQKIDNIGSGEGYYITEGYAVPITWEKSDEKSQTKYKVKATGNDLIVNDGNTYIQIYPTSGSLSIN